MAINLCFIQEEYFMQHSTFSNMLDPGNLSKQNHRTHLCLVEEQTEQRIPNMQYQKIEAEYEIIKREFDTYLRGFKRAMMKNRIQKEPLYRVSSLINFLDELKA